MNSRLLMLVCLVFSVVVIYNVCNNETKQPDSSTWSEIICEECNGNGYMIYSESHDLVLSKIVEPHKQYNCIMCAGSGILERRNYDSGKIPQQNEK